MGLADAALRHETQQKTLLYPALLPSAHPQTLTVCSLPLSPPLKITVLKYKFVEINWFQVFHHFRFYFSPNVCL